VLLLIHQGAIFNHTQPSLHLQLQLVLLQKKHLKIHIYKVRHHLVLYRITCECFCPTEPAPIAVLAWFPWLHLTRVRVSLLIPLGLYTLTPHHLNHCPSFPPEASRSSSSLFPSSPHLLSAPAGSS